MGIMEKNMETTIWFYGDYYKKSVPSFLAIAKGKSLGQRLRDMFDCCKAPCCKAPSELSSPGRPHFASFLRGQFGVSHNYGVPF